MQGSWWVFPIRTDYCAAALLLAVLALLARPLAAQPVFKWVDEKGRTHYSDTAPASGAFEQLDTLPELNLLPSDALEDFPPQLQRTKVKSRPTAILLNPDSKLPPPAPAGDSASAEYTYLRHGYPLFLQRRYCVGERCKLKPQRPGKHKPLPHKPALSRRPVAKNPQIKPLGFKAGRAQRVCRSNCEPLWRQYYRRNH